MGKQILNNFSKNDISQRIYKHIYITSGQCHGQDFLHTKPHYLSTKIEKTLVLYVPFFQAIVDSKYMFLLNLTHTP